MIDVIEAKAWHVGAVIHRLRPAHQAALTARGIDPHRALRAIYEQSTLRRTGLIDGRVVAIGGITGSLVSSMGFVWLALTADASRHTVALIRECRRQLDAAMATRIEIATTVLPEDDAARRFAAYLGFHLGHGEGEGRAVCRAGRRALTAAMEESAANRLPWGNGFAVAIGYHRGDSVGAV